MKGRAEKYMDPNCELAHKCVDQLSKVRHLVWTIINLRKMAWESGRLGQLCGRVGQ